MRPHRSLRLLTALAAFVVARPSTAETGAPASPAPVPTGGGRSLAPTLTLAEAEAETLRSQPSLTQARGQLEAAEGRAEQARAGYLPQIALAGVYQRTTGNFAPRPGALPTMTASTARSTTTYNYFSLGLTGTQLLYDFGQTTNRIGAARASRDAARISEQAVTAQALLNVRRAYFQARAQRDLVDVAEETVSNQEKHVMQIQQFVRAGMRPDIDLAQARTALGNAQLALVTANNNLAVSLAQLNSAMGLPAGPAYRLTDSDLPAVSGEGAAPATLGDQAVRARPELSALAEQRRAAALTVSALRGSYGPALGATAGATETGSALDRLVPNWYVGLQLTWPLFQGGLSHGQVREARGTLAGALAQEQAARLAIRVEVEQARLGITAAKASIEATDQALTNAREQLRLAEGRYKAGLGNAIELDDAQVAFSNARAQQVSARFGLASARAQLLTALGAR